MMFDLIFFLNRYKLDNGEQFIGTAIHLNMFSNVYMMIGADETFYQVNYSEDDLKKDSLDKIVNYGKLIYPLVFVSTWDE